MTARQAALAGARRRDRAARPARGGKVDLRRDAGRPGPARRQRTACRGRPQAQRLAGARRAGRRIAGLHGAQAAGHGRELAAFGPLERLADALACASSASTASATTCASSPARRPRALDAHATAARGACDNRAHVHRHHHRPRPHRRRAAAGRRRVPRQAPDDRSAGRLPRRRAARRQHRAQRRLHDGHRASTPPHAASASTSRPKAWTRPPAWASPAPVNLEKALRAHDRLGGHLVSGHVDGIGTRRPTSRRWASRWELRISAPRELARFLAYKGSITVNGVSLTVNRVADLPDGCEFSINLIPHTLQNTTLGHAAGRAARQPRDRPDRALRRAHARAASLPRH